MVVTLRSFNSDRYGREVEMELARGRMTSKQFVRTLSLPERRLLQF
jgi:hypothetical protein